MGHRAQGMGHGAQGMGHGIKMGRGKTDQEKNQI